MHPFAADDLQGHARDGSATLSPSVTSMENEGSARRRAGGAPRSFLGRRCEMRKTMMGWVVTTLAITAVFAVPSDVESQSSPGARRAAQLESEASRLHGQRQQWAYAADLYLAAVQLREDGDPQAQADLLLAANLGYESDEKCPMQTRSLYVVTSTPGS